MSDKYRSTYRGYLIDHHSPDSPIITLDKLDPNEYETFFKEANINSLMLYCKDHWGNSYYDTEVGKKHSGLDMDWIAKLRPVLKRNEIEFDAYYCLEYDTYAPVAHPEWAIVKADGTPLTCTSPVAKWRMPCYETGYREYALGQLREIGEKFRPDSLFLDIFGKSLCYCPVCRAKFEARYGYPLPDTPEGIMEHVADINRFLDDSAISMLDDISKLMKDIDPTIKISVNFSALYCKEIRDKLDFQFTEPFAGNWLSAAYARDTAIGQYPQLGPGNVSEVYNYNPDNVYILAASEIAAQGCRVFMYSGSQHPDGTLEHEEARHVGSAYREVEKFEKYLFGREVMADVAIIQSDASVPLNNNEPLVPNAIGRVRQGSFHRDSIVGAMRLCDSSALSWKILPEQYITKDGLDGYKMVILPDMFYVSPEIAEAIRGYVKNGGKLLTSGLTGMFDSNGNMLSDFVMSDIIGATFIEQYDRYAKAPWSAYLAPTDEPLLKSISRTMPPVSGKVYRVRPTDGKAISAFVTPAVELTNTTWVNWWCPPPKRVTNDPAFIVNHVGEGTVIYAAFDMMRMAKSGEYNYLPGLFNDIADELVSKPTISFKREHIYTLSYVSYRRPEQDDMIVHVVSHAAEKMSGDAPEIKNGCIELSNVLGVRAAEMVYPEQKSLDVVKDGDITRISLPPISIHQVIRLARN